MYRSGLGSWGKESDGLQRKRKGKLHLGWDPHDICIKQRGAQSSFFERSLPTKVLTGNPCNTTMPRMPPQPVTTQVPAKVQRQQTSASKVPMDRQQSDLYVPQWTGVMGKGNWTGCKGQERASHIWDEILPSSASRKGGLKHPFMEDFFQLKNLLAIHAMQLCLECLLA